MPVSLADRMNHQHSPSTNHWFILFGPPRYLLHVCIYIYIQVDPQWPGPWWKGPSFLTGWPSNIRSIIWAPGPSFGLGIARWIHMLQNSWPSKNESVQIKTHSIHAPDIEYLYNIYHPPNQPVMFVHIPVSWMVWDIDSWTWKNPYNKWSSCQGDQHFQRHQTWIPCTNLSFRPV